MRHQARHAHNSLAKHGDEAGWHFQPAHPRPKPSDAIRDGEMWSDRLPLIVVPFSKSWNGASVVSEVLDLHNGLSAFSGFTPSGRYAAALCSISCQPSIFRSFT